LHPIQVFQQAKRRERQIQDVHSPFAQAKANLAFMDRLKRVISQFEDSHLRLEEMVPYQKVFLGVQTRLAGGRVYVTGLEDGLTPSLTRQQPSISLGDELLQVNGQPVDDLLDDLETYIPASSAAYRRQRAAEALGKRSFLWPQAPTSHWTLRASETGERYSVDLAWAVSPDNLRPDLRTYLARLGVQLRQEKDYYGFRHDDPPRQLAESKTWYGANSPEELVYRTGWLTRDGRRAGVIQLYSFYHLDVLQADHDRLVSWEEPLVAFIRQLNRCQCPLVVDLRWNEGGHTFLAETFLQLIAQADTSYASYTEGFRLTPSIRQMWQSYQASQPVYSAEDQAARFVNEAAMNRRSHTHVWAHSEALRAHRDIGGYNQDVVTLISPYCMSTCELLVMMLQARTHTNGTGAGFFEWEPFAGAAWRDSYEAVYLEIPNYLLGRPGEVGQRIFNQRDAYFTYNKENQPVKADITYRPGLSDYLAGAPGWYNRAWSVVFRQQSVMTH
jgi:hypothetical protein